MPYLELWIYHKFWGVLIPYYTCPKICTLYLLLCLKTTGWLAKSVLPDQNPHSAVSDQGLHCLRTVCLLKTSIKDIFFRNPVFKRISPKFNSKKIKLDFTIFFFLHTHVVGTHHLGLLQYIVTEIQSVVAESGCRKYRKCNYYMGCVCVHLCVWGRAGLSGSVGCAVRLETRRSQVQPPPRSATFFRGDWSWNIFYGHSLPSADSRRAVVSFWRKNVHNTG